MSLLGIEERKKGEIMKEDVEGKLEEGRKEGRKKEIGTEKVRIKEK
jgi:hypothetical protein